MREQTVYLVYMKHGITGLSDVVMVFARREAADEFAKHDPRYFVQPWDMVL